MKRVLIVGRESAHSTRPEADGRLLGVISGKLVRSGFTVILAKPDIEAVMDAMGQLKPEAVLSMARDVQFLSRMERALKLTPKPPKLLLNGPAAAIRCTRRRFLLHSEHLSKAVVPKWLDGNQAGIWRSSKRGLHRPVWIHHKDYNAGTAWAGTLHRDIDSVRKVFRSNDQTQIIVQHHVEGQLRKVYCADGTVMSAQCISDEIVCSMREIASVFNTRFFGADFVIDGTSVYLIDLNDWPSFGNFQKTVAERVFELIDSSEN